MKSLKTKTALAFLLVAIIESLVMIYLRNAEIDLTNKNVLVLLGVGTSVGFVLNMILYEFLIDLRLRNITHEIDNLISGQQYEEIDERSKDEIGIFARFFNEMTRQIENIAGNLKNAERLSDEIGLAAKIQSDVLPKKAPIIPGIEMVAKTRSAAEIGGDSFDFIKSNNQTMFYIGDVTGHGVPAGLIMMMVNILLRAFAPMHQKTSDILIKTNSIIHPRIAANMFMTLVMLRWDEDDQRLFYTGCGHEHYLHYHASTGKCEAVKCGGIALGMVPEIKNMVQEKEINFQEGDILALYTDGIAEAKNAQGEMFGVERLRQVVEEFGGRTSSESVFDNISRRFGEFVGKYSDQKDDITLIVLKNRGRNYAQEAIKLEVNKRHLEDSPIWTW